MPDQDHQAIVLMCTCTDTAFHRLLRDVIDFSSKSPVNKGKSDEVEIKNP
jgi:hypothetical protein